jgi:isoleucyl-tRNA synthetase
VIEDVVRGVLMTLWNTHHFFCSYARIDSFSVDTPVAAVADRPVGDRWILAELADTVDTTDAALDRFDVSTACRRIQQFIDDLSNWYVRRNRRRFWRGAAEDPADKAAAYHTLYTCLTTTAALMAPFTPFIADQLWEDLVGGDSVHLTDFPQADGAWHDPDLRASMAVVKRIIEVGRQARSDSGLKTRQPLARALVSVPAAQRDAVRGWLDEIAEELNIRAVEVHEAAEDEVVDRAVKPKFNVLGPRFGADAPHVASALRDADAATVARLTASSPATLVVEGHDVEVTSDMFEVIESPRTGWQVASDGAVLIALDTTLDEDLLVEGASRQLVRLVNQERKNLDLALTDRVEVTVDLPPDVDRLLEAAGWYDVLARETLATEVHRRPVPRGSSTEVDLGSLGIGRFVIVPAG